MIKTNRSDKRARLIQSADKLFYEQTFHTTTLADIAKSADVPLGNVYYYFKTKNDIMETVLADRSKHQQELFKTWEANFSTAQDRLKAMLQYFIEQAEPIARYGCIAGSLAQELGKQTNDSLSQIAAKILSDFIQWAKVQFEMFTKGHNSQTLAEFWIANLEGMSLLTLTFKNPDLMKKQAKNLEGWLETLA